MVTRTPAERPEEAPAMPVSALLRIRNGTALPGDEEAVEAWLAATGRDRRGDGDAS